MREARTWDLERCFLPLRPGQASVLDHQAAVLDDFDAGPSELFRNNIVANARLKPDRRGFLSQQIVQMKPDILGSAKDIDEIDRARNLSQFAKDFAAKDFLDFGIVNRNGNYLEAGPDEIFGYVERGLIRLGFGLHAEHGDTPGLQDQSADVRGSDD